MQENTKGLIDIGRLIFRFAKVNRVTLHEDGVTPESDTDHTVMLSVCACALASKLYPYLDIGKVAQFATVHDLVEAYAMDTDSFGITEEERKNKEEREHQAFLRIEEEFKDTYPWLPTTIREYEALSSPEACFVKTVDKIMSKISHITNDGAYFKKRGLSEEEMWRDYTTMVQTAEEKYGAEFPEITQMMYSLMEEVRKKTYHGE